MTDKPWDDGKWTWTDTSRKEQICRMIAEHTRYELLVKHVVRELRALIEHEIISMGRAAEVLGISLTSFRAWVVESEEEFPFTPRAVLDEFEKNGGLNQRESLILAALKRVCEERDNAISDCKIMLHAHETDNKPPVATVKRIKEVTP